MSKLKKALRVFGQNIHGNKNLNEDEATLLNEAVEESRERFADYGITIPLKVEDRKTETLYSIEETNRRIYNIVRNKTGDAIEKAIVAMSKGTTRTPFMKDLEAIGVNTPESVQRNIMENALDKRQNLNKLPKQYRNAIRDKVDVTLPNRTTMMAEIKRFWKMRRNDSALIKLVASQRLEIDAELERLGRMQWGEIAYFYVTYFEQGDIFEQFREPGSGGGGNGSIYTKGMADLRRKINYSSGKTYKDVPIYFTEEATFQTMNQTEEDE